MKKSLVAKGAIRLALAAALVFAGTFVTTAKPSHADEMGCYGWFDYVYKATGDSNFANWHFEQCLTWKTAVKAQLAPDRLHDIIIPIDGSEPFVPVTPRPRIGPGITPTQPIVPIQPIVPGGPIGPNRPAGLIVTR